MYTGAHKRLMNIKPKCVYFRGNKLPHISKPKTLPEKSLQVQIYMPQRRASELINLPCATISFQHFSAKQHAGQKDILVEGIIYQPGQGQLR